MKKVAGQRLLLVAMALMVAMTSSSCVTRRAADILTLRQRARDGEFWEKKAGTTFTRFEVKAKDGVILSALEVAPATGARKLGTAYLFHGLGNSKEQMLPTAKSLSDAGFRCIAWDSRGHGKSGGVRATYGTQEVEDALRVIKEARKRDRRPRGHEVVWGFSMGTAVALQTLPSMPEARGAVLLAPIADLNGVLQDQARNHYHGAMTPLVPVVRASVRYRAGFDPKSIRPVDAVTRTDCKLLLIHGAQDRIVFPAQSKRILEASAPGQARRILLPGFSHQGVMWDLPDRTRREAVEFLVEEASRR